MRLFLVRHGQSTGNVNPREYFNKIDSDIGLTEVGKGQAAGVYPKIVDILNHFKSFNRYPNKDIIRFNMFYSPYKRTIETANIIKETSNNIIGYSINPPCENVLLREREWGSLRDIVEMGEKNDSHFNFYYRPNGGESFADCFNRVALFHQWLLNTTKYENNIVVAHGEFNKLYLMYLLGWTVEEFDKRRHPLNCEVFLIDDGNLSSLTPVREKHIKH